jgi:hypothetical protein
MKFDEMCRLIASSLPRRRVFQILLGSFLAALRPRRASAQQEGAQEGVVVKRQVVNIKERTEAACNFQLQHVRVMNCPPRTRQEIDIVQPCRKQGNFWVAKVVMVCIRRPISPP